MTLKPVTREVPLETTTTRERNNLKLPDAIHVATAKLSNCRYFVSRDRLENKLPIELRQVIPDQDGLAHLIGALHA